MERKIKPMYFIYLIVVLLVLYFAYVFIRLHYIVKNSGVHPYVHTTLTSGSGTALKYVAAGDSTANGEGASRVEDAYPNLLFNELSKSNVVTYHNFAVSGATTQDVLDNQLSKIVAENPDLVTISIGANDLNHVTFSKDVLKNYQEIIATVHDETHAKLYITNIPNLRNGGLLPGWYTAWVDLQAQRLNAKISLMAGDRVDIVDIHAVKAELAGDRFHPSSRGYQEWYRAFLEKIAKKD